MKIIIYSVGKDENGKTKMASVITNQNAHTFNKYTFENGIKDIHNFLKITEYIGLLYFDKINTLLQYDSDASKLIESFGVKNNNFPSSTPIDITIAQQEVNLMKEEKQRKIASFFNEPYTLFDETNTIKSILVGMKKI